MKTLMLAALSFVQPGTPAEKPAEKPAQQEQRPAKQPEAKPDTKPETKAPDTKPETKSDLKIEITVNSDEAPEFQSWGEDAKKICEEWWPKIAKELPSDGWKPRDKVLFLFKKSYNVPAAATGDKIMINAEHVRNNKGDLGMMVHELVHIAQAYPRQKENLGWLTEGIADYIRFYLYEPQTRQRQIDVKKASYRDAYRTTAAFLGWLVQTHDKEIVAKLNGRLRAGKGEAAMFKEFTGKTVDELWKDFIDAGAPSSPKALEELKAKGEPAKTEPAKSEPVKDAKPK